MECSCYAAMNGTDPLVPWKIKRRDPKPNDVVIKIHYCGICHSDIHQARKEWQEMEFIMPMVPGHEMVGVVEKVGAQVKKHKVGDRVGVGCMVESCRACVSCKKGDEQYCYKSFVPTYNGRYVDGEITYGGYSQCIVVNEDFVLKVNPKLPMDAAAPLLCAGITMWSPMKYYGVDRPGLKVGVAGLGGLGHMAVKFGVAFGCEVHVLSRTASKESEALHKLGAKGFILTTKSLTEHAATFDFILDTISADHDLSQLLDVLKPDGSLIMVGVPTKPVDLACGHIIMKRRKLVGSLIGSIHETQEMLDFCAEKNIVCDIEKISVDKVNEAYERTINSDVKYRFVLDIIDTLK